MLLFLHSCSVLLVVSHLFLRSYVRSLFCLFICPLSPHLQPYSCLSHTSGVLLLLFVCFFCFPHPHLLVWLLFQSSLFSKFFHFTHKHSLTYTFLYLFGFAFLLFASLLFSSWFFLSLSTSIIHTNPSLTTLPDYLFNGSSVETMWVQLPLYLDHLSFRVWCACHCFLHDFTNNTHMLNGISPCILASSFSLLMLGLRIDVLLSLLH